MTGRTSAVAKVAAVLDPAECATLAIMLIAQLDAAGIERAGAAMFANLVELGKTSPGAVDAVVTAMVNHLRSWRPESVMPLSFGPPTDPAAIRDPRD